MVRELEGFGCVGIELGGRGGEGKDAVMVTEEFAGGGGGVDVKWLGGGGNGGWVCMDVDVDLRLRREGGVCEEGWCCELV